MKFFKCNFKLLLSAPLFSVILYDGASQSTLKMPDKNQWTMSNLNVDIPGSYCYNDSVKFCQKYGRLYTWEAAKEGCRSLGEGWHLPSTEEWHNLLNHFGGEYQESKSDGKEACQMLLRKSIFGVNLGGNRNVDGTYARIEAHGFYWTSTPFDENQAGFLNFAKGKKTLLIQPDMEKMRAISVRCIKNN